MRQNPKRFRILRILITALLAALLFSSCVYAKKAKYYRPSQAASWIRKQAGKAVYYWNPKSQAQCTELVYSYYRYLDVNAPDTDAWQYSEAKPPSGWKKIPYYNGFTAQPGDVAVWTGGRYGHVALIVSADSSSFQSLDQNMNGRHYAAFYRHSYKPEGELTFWGVIRPGFKKGKQDSHAVSSGRKIRSCVYYYSGSGKHFAVSDIQIRLNKGKITCSCRVYRKNKLLSRKKYSIRYSVNRKKKTVSISITGKGAYRKCLTRVTVPVT